MGIMAVVTRRRTPPNIRFLFRRSIKQKLRNAVLEKHFYDNINYIPIIKISFPVWWSLSDPSGFTGASLGDLPMDYLIATKPVDPQLKAILSRASKQGT